MSKAEDMYGDEVAIGRYMKFEGKDSRYEGHVVAVFQKRNYAVDISGKPPYTGVWRVVIQDDRGLLLIKDPEAGEVKR